MGLGERLYEQQLQDTREMVQNPTWYLEFNHAEKLKIIGRTALSGLSMTEQSLARRVNDGAYRVFEDLLAEGAVPLGEVGQSEPDIQRQSIDRIVIHHSSRNKMSSELLSAMELIRLYVPEYARLPSSDPEYHMPIYSGHFRNDKQVFWPYHWFIDENGETERLLEDSEIGWHAGDWDMNTRSVAITVNANLEHRKPNDNTVMAISQLILDNYPDVDINNNALLGHNEVNTKTSCPGKGFHGPDGWKRDILDEIAA